jgi:S1-C subfamily serine protease
MFEDPLVTARSAETQPDSPPPGPAWPGVAQNPGSPPGRPGARRRLMAITAALALTAGAGTAWALNGGGATATVLTTAQIAAKTNPAVVDVLSTLGLQGGAAAGTGIVLTSSGEVLTNNHVIDGATSVKVRDVGNGQTYTAAVVGYDASHDIAVLQLKGASGLATATLGNSSKVSVGEKVVAVGNAGGQDGTPSVATGRVTGLGQSITASDASSGTSEQLTGLIRTNAGIQPGDSGGPLLNAYGQVIGLNTAASSGSGNQLSSSTATQAFTVPINEAVSIARQIEAGSSTATVHVGPTAFLGVAVTSGVPGLPASAAAEVAGVGRNSAAANAGLTAGDAITSLGGHSITSPAQIRSVLTAHHPGDRIGITWTDQGGQSHTATVVLSTGPAG